MGSEQMTDKLSKDLHDHILNTKIIPNELGKVESAQGRPRMFLLGGQPGAGKSGMTRSIKDSLEDPKDPKKKSAVTIDMDELRIYHPDYLKFVRENSDTAADRVQADASAWAAELYEEALKRRVNVIYDGTLAVASKAKDMVTAADKTGYAVEVHVVATSFEASQQGVRNRYEEALVAYKDDPKKNAPPRTVPDRIQRNAYDNIPGTLGDLCKTGIVSRMRVASRNGDELCDLVGKGKVKRDGAISATRALEAERSRVWTEQEIYEYIDRGKKIVGNMERRRANKGKIEEVRERHGAVIDEKVKVLDEDNKKKDAWMARVVNVDIKGFGKISDDAKAVESREQEDQRTRKDSEHIVIEDSSDEDDVLIGTGERQALKERTSFSGRKKPDMLAELEQQLDPKGKGNEIASRPRVKSH
jgi:hypothetical protein